MVAVAGAVAGQLQDPAEAARLRAVARYVVLDTASEPDFNDVAAVAAAVTGCARAAITFVDATHVHTKAAYGFCPATVPRYDSPFPPGAPLHRVVVPDVAALRSPFWGAYAEGARFYAAEPLTTADGFVLGHLAVMNDAPGELSDTQQRYLAALARQVLNLLELRRTRVGYHTVIDAAGMVVFHLDDRLRLVSVTPTWAILTGYGVVRSLGQPLCAMLHADDREDAEARLRRVLGEGAPSRWDCRLQTLAGADVPVEVFATALPRERGTPPGVVGVLTDITERRSRELELQHTQRLESLGRLAAGVAHEINTPIQFVGDNTRFLAEACAAMLDGLERYRQIASDDELRGPDRAAAVTHVDSAVDLEDLADEVPSAVTQTLDGVERVANIVRAMKSLSHPGHQEPVLADVNDALRSTVTVARNEMKYDADVVVDLADLPKVPCYIADLGQVFLNLLVNAADAVRDSGQYGRITVRSAHDGDDILVSVSDTGVGIPPDGLLRIFEPFYTTKPVGRGTGQGLAFARAVVDKHGGALEVNSTVGVGSTFTVRIPTSGPTQEMGA